jgi:hypothetical protein
VNELSEGALVVGSDIVIELMSRQQKSTIDGENDVAFCEGWKMVQYRRVEGLGPHCIIFHYIKGLKAFFINAIFRTLVSSISFPPFLLYSPTCSSY